MTKKVHNHKRVFILGAGFSRARGMPLMGDFSLRMRDALEWCESKGRESERKAIEDVLDFRLSATGAAYRINLDLENIEELFSLAAAAAPRIAKQVCLSIAATLNFCEQTWPEPRALTTYGHSAKFHERRSMVDKSTTHWKEVPLYQALLANLMETHELDDVSFITFNYDLLLEGTLQSLSVPLHYGFKSRQATVDKSARYYAETGVPIYKLHGSINWAYPGRRGNKFTVYGNYEELYSKGLVPEIVPPTWNKIVTEKLIDVWSGAVNAMAEATEIIVAGFSMPPTDLHFKYLFAAGIRENISLRKITFVAPDDQMPERLMRVFTANEFTTKRVSHVYSRLEDLYFKKDGDFFRPLDMNAVPWFESAIARLT